MRKIATLLVALGLTLGLLGAGISATFTDNASATMTVQVGTFDISLASSQGTVDCPAGLGVCTVTYTAPDIMSSTAANAPLTFTVTSNGTIPAKIHVTATTPAAPFTDMLGPVADFTLGQNESHVFNGGIAWPELFNAQLGMSTSVTYTVAASDL